MIDGKPHEIVDIMPNVANGIPFWQMLWLFSYVDKCRRWYATVTDVKYNIILRPEDALFVGMVKACHQLTKISTPR